MKFSGQFFRLTSLIRCFGQVFVCVFQELWSCCFYACMVSMCAVAMFLCFRSCGHVFCADCSDYSLPVPQQHLDKPVRVCFHCYRQASASSDTPSAAAANPSDAVNGGSKAILGFGFTM